VKNLFKTILCFFGLACWTFTAIAQEKVMLNWETLATFSLSQGKENNLGYAGIFAGIQDDLVILAGGANFPNGMPWEGGNKKWYDTVYLLRKNNGGYEWVPTGNMRLPMPMAYGASVSHMDGVILIGGENEQGVQSSVLKIKWNDELDNLSIEKLPSLPIPLSHASSVILNQKIYVAGGESSSTSDGFWMLDLAKLELGWKSLPSWPGPARSNAAMVAQTAGDYDKIFLFGGRKKTETGISEIFGDVFQYDPKSNTWDSLGQITDSEGEVRKISAFSAVAAGSGHILIFGGVEKEPFNTLESIAFQLSKENSGFAALDSLEKMRISILNNHPGFSRKVMAFHTVTKTWTALDDLPFETPVNTTALRMENDILIPSGEIYPGVRSPKIQKLQIINHQSFGTLNYIVLGTYLGILVLMGLIISKKQHNVSDYFKAGGRVPWWAAGISVFGTQLSAITFMAIPAKTFATDWTLFILLMTIIMVSPIIIAWFLPFFRRLNLTTAYEYLELRFNKTVRTMGSVIYVVLQLGRLGIVLLLPSLALSVVTGINVEICILIMGVLSILYTVLGGIEAVIWTDVIQVLVLLGGALICLVMMVIHMDMDWATFKVLAVDTGKTRLFDFSFDFTGTAIWVVLIGGLAANIVQYGSDQTVIQRYLTTKDEKTAAKGIVTGAWMALPSALIFFSIGTALYLFYLQHPQDLSPVIQNTDSIFPWYIVTQLPQGISGLLIAAVFAAAMSSLDSSMNSVATVITTDFHEKWFPKAHAAGKELSFARWVTVVVGVGGTILALVMAKMGIPSLWDQFNMLIGLFAGGLGGVFLIGILSKRVNGNGAILGLIASALVQVLVKYFTPLSLHLYAFTGLVSAVTFTYLFSLFFNHPPNSKLEGLTLKSLEGRIKKSKVGKRVAYIKSKI
jgi:solute:Na+ symporter, SSS family